MTNIIEKQKVYKSVSTVYKAVVFAFTLLLIINFIIEIPF